MKECLLNLGAGYIVALIIVCISVWRDMIHHQISLYLLVGGSIAAVVMRIMTEASFKEGIVGCIPGMIFLICGYVTRHAVGYGDGWMFMIIGMCLGIKESVMVLSVCLIMIAVYGLFIMIIRKKTRKTAVAVMPWLLCALLVCCAIPG